MSWKESTYLAIVIVAVIAVWRIPFGEYSRDFEGVIPISATPTFRWVEGGATTFEWRGEIPVVIGKDTVIAEFTTEGYWLGRLLVEHHNSYPPSIGKQIKVKGDFRKDGKPRITQADYVR